MDYIVDGVKGSRIKNLSNVVGKHNKIRQLC